MLAHDPKGNTEKLSPLDLVVVGMVAGILLFAALGERDLWNPNEPTYGRAVVEMDDRGDWMLPSVNGRIFAEKPILYFWSALAAAGLTGEIDEWSLRLPSALAGLGSVVLTYLLVLPYAGRRRAGIAALLLVTQYQVFWASRSVQMDILVLFSSLGVIVPLTRKLDFGMSPSKAWGLAGLAAGLGFAAKGPVSLVIPGLAITLYAVSQGRLRALYDKHFLAGATVALLVASPWYLFLWLRGETEFLIEVLYRQNFTRFTEAWDHIQPWWYYLEYIWIDYAPWSWFLPAAFLIPRGELDKAEVSLHRLSWLWIVATVVFFSLSESKRAPYILPISPAIAALVAGVVDRWLSGVGLNGAARRASVVAATAFYAAFSLGGLLALTRWRTVPEVFQAPVLTLGIFFLASAALGWSTLLRRERWSPAVLFVVTTAFFLLAATWILPRMDAAKSPRDFSRQMARIVDESCGRLASLEFWDWRAGYSYYAERSIENLESRRELERYWSAHPRPCLLVESRDAAGRLAPPIEDAKPLLSGQIGGRTAVLYGPAPKRSTRVFESEVGG